MSLSYDAIVTLEVEGFDARLSAANVLETIKIACQLEAIPQKNHMSVAVFKMPHAIHSYSKV